MPAVRVDRLAASHQLYVLLLACSDDRLVSMFFIPWLAAVLHQAHQGLRVSPGVQDAFRISSVVEMMKLKNLQATTALPQPRTLKSVLE